MQEMTTENEASQMLEGFEVHPADDRVIYIEGENLDIVVPFIRAGFIQAAIVKETPEDASLRTAFAESLTPEKWTFLNTFAPKMLMSPGVGHSFQFNSVSPPHQDIPPYLMEEIERNLRDIVEYDCGINGAHSETLMRIPGSGVRAKYWTFHEDSNFPVTKHRTLFGSGLEWLGGELSPNEAFLQLRDYPEFLRTVAPDRIQTVGFGDTIWFGDTFIHRATSKAATQGYIVTTTSPAVSPYVV